jgi:hypothetical protein
LSNVQALELFQHYKSSALQLLILSHLSKNNNKPELVEKLFAPHAGNTRVVIASRYEQSEVFEVKVEVEKEVKNKVKINAKVKKKIDGRQLRLF